MVSVEYDRDDFVYDLLHSSPLVFGSVEGMNNILWVFKGMSEIVSNGYARLENVERIVHAFMDMELSDPSNYMNISIFLRRIDLGGPREYVVSVLKRLLECYLLYELPDHPGIFVSVNTIDLLRNPEYRDYYLVDTGIIAEPVAFANYSPHRISDEPIIGMPFGPRKLYDLVPGGYIGPMIRGINNREQRNVLYATINANENLYKLMADIRKYPNKKYEKDDTYVQTLSILFSNCLLITSPRYNR
jgi:hypothetical protein